MAKKFSQRLLETSLKDVEPGVRAEHLEAMTEQLIKLAQSAQISLDGFRASVKQMEPVFDWIREQQRGGYVGREFSPHQMPPIWLEGAMIREFTRQEIPGTRRTHQDKTIIPTLVQQMVQNLKNLTLTDPLLAEEEAARRQAQAEKDARELAERKEKREHVKAALSAIGGDGYYEEADLPEAIRDYLETVGIMMDLAFITQVMKEFGYFDPNLTLRR